jgi:hypothetical protein
MKLQDIKRTPNTTYSQSTATVRSEDDNKHTEGKHAHSTSTGLTVPKSVHSRIMSARSDKDESAKPKAETTPASTPQHTEAEIADMFRSFADIGVLEKDKKVAEAKIALIDAKAAYDAVATVSAPVPADVATALTAYKAVFTKHLEFLPPNPATGNKYIDTEINSFDEITLNGIKHGFDGGRTKPVLTTDITGYDAKLTPLKAKTKPLHELFNREHFDKAGIENIAKQHKGLGLWGWAGITALSLIPAGIQWFMGNNASKAAEAKADAAKQETEALKEQIQGLLQQLGQVMMSMQAKGEKANAQLTNLVARLIKLQGQSLKTASAPAHSTASKSARSDDTSATPPNQPAGEPNLADLEKQVAELEKQQASGGGKPAPAQPQGGGTPHTGAIPQPVTMPQQNGQATESPMPQQSETQRIRFHRFPEDARNDAVPTNAFLGDKVITRKVSNTGDRAIIEKDDDC